MPTLTIDGKEIWVEPGTTVLEAAKLLGIEIPHYCYHPGLGIAGSCRMCLVEVEGMPKLQISCHLQAADGMVVRTNTQKVQQARKSVLEFLLVNHPLDCPVCDQAGECYLQIYYMEYGLHRSRLHEDKLKKQKAKSLGEHIVLDQERCVLCSRCVRFTEQITKTYELGIFQRGDRSVVDLYPGVELHNRYQGNLADICPVGALTDKEFRFQTRVWYLQTQKSVCPGCSRGCNIDVHYNIRKEYKAGGRRVPRVTPRFNPKVNGHWMCDDGRYGFKYVDAVDRILRPRRRTDSADFEPVSWQEALAASAQALSAPDRVGVLLSARMSNEELFAAKKLFMSLNVRLLGHRVNPAVPGYEDELLIRADKYPNATGARLMGLGLAGEDSSDLKVMLDALQRGQVKTLVVFHENLELSDQAEHAAEVLPRVEHLVYVGTNWNSTASAADLVLPAASFVEKEGTLTNFAGRIQRFWPAVSPLGEALPELAILARLAEAVGAEALPTEAEAVFDLLAGEEEAFSGITYAEVGDQGTPAHVSVEDLIPV